MASLFSYCQTNKFTNMSNLQEKVNKEYPLYDIPNSISKIDEYNGNEIQLIKRSAFQNGYEQCKKEYEENLRWIPVEEKLPEKIQKQPYISHVVQVKSTTYAEPLCAYYNHDHFVWLSYPFGDSAKLLTVTHWRYFL